MQFEILSDISDIETFATGSAIREIAGCEESTDAVAGVNARESPASDWQIALSISLKYIGTNPPGSGARNSRSSTCFKSETMAKSQARRLVVCIDNEGYPASIERRKIYVALRDIDAEKHGLLRIVDESGDDYLYPKMFFRSIALPQSVKKAVLNAA